LPLLGLDLVFLLCYDFRLTLCSVIVLLYLVEQQRGIGTLLCKGLVSGS